MKVIEISNLNKIYKERDIFKRLRGGKKKIGVENVSFSVNEGEIFSIIGLNGAGKTTIMKCLLGLLDYDSGKIDIYGKGELQKDSKASIGYLPEISYYPKSISLNTLMEYYGDLYGMKNCKEKVNLALERLGLIDRKNSRLEEFSKGMLQKVGIAQAILNEPKLLFLDEPMSGLDPLARGEIIELLKELKSKGTTIFLNTHILSDIETIGDRGIVVHKGKVLDSFDIKEKRRKENYIIGLDNKEIIEVDEKELENKLRELKGIKDIRKNHFSLEKYFKELVLGGEK